MVIDRAPHHLLEEAIMEGARAGVFRRAARLNPCTAKTWNSLAATHSDRATKILALVQGDEN